MDLQTQRWIVEIAMSSNSNDRSMGILEVTQYSVLQGTMLSLPISRSEDRQCQVLPQSNNWSLAIYLWCWFRNIKHKMAALGA
ncbi:hypothetical protein TNCV_3937511 [Trichonephila clavipes]|nr:hypothetical protein TNCV_3937511 [Trichonephila clavipes]